MTIYEHRTTMTATAGSAMTVTLPRLHGIMHQLLVRANTDTTLFRVNLTDNNSVIRLNYAFHRGEINDVMTRLPLQGQYTVQVTNASQSDAFTVVLAARDQ